ncbi:hypothetical protein [Persephonella sp.]
MYYTFGGYLIFAISAASSGVLPFSSTSFLTAFIKSGLFAL